MDNRGEIIVSLARALLEGKGSLPIGTGTDNGGFSTKITDLSAKLCSYNQTNKNNQHHTKRLDRYQRIEIEALIFYTARLFHQSEGSIKLEIEEQTHINPDDLKTHNHYLTVRQYLWDQLDCIRDVTIQQKA